MLQPSRSSIALLLLLLNRNVFSSSFCKLGKFVRSLSGGGVGVDTIKSFCELFTETQTYEFSSSSLESRWWEIWTRSCEEVLHTLSKASSSSRRLLLRTLAADVSLIEPILWDTDPKSVWKITQKKKKKPIRERPRQRKRGITSHLIGLLTTHW